MFDLKDPAGILLEINQCAQNLPESFTSVSLHSAQYVA